MITISMSKVEFIQKYKLKKLNSTSTIETQRKLGMQWLTIENRGKNNESFRVNERRRQPLDHIDNHDQNAAKQIYQSYIESE